MRGAATLARMPEFGALGLDDIQWPAMVASVLAAWLVASNRPGRRHTGFWVFLASNVLWVLWGWHSGGYALIVLQFALALMNIRGLRKTEAARQAGGAGP
jgi:hypothetical protein